MSVTEETRTFPVYRFAGSHRAIGEQFGETCRELIRQHRDLALTRLGERSHIPPDRAVQAALAYRPFVVEYARFFDEEIQGLAAGTGLSLAEAYLLQLRAELAVVQSGDPAAEPPDECTTFAALPAATANGETLAGQNADLPAFYRDIAVVTEIVPDDMPAVLMLTPAGQVSYIGINDRGLAVFANYLTCGGWRVGFPRYLLSRLALTHDNVDDGIAAVRAVPRASSRNLLLADARGTAADLETTPTRDARLEPEHNLLAHSNHYLAPSLADEERSPASYVKNSRARLDRIRECLTAARGRLDPATMQEIYRDRTNAPDCLCRMPGDTTESDTITFASVIAEPAAGAISVAVGPPNEHPYQRYTFTA